MTIEEILNAAAVCAYPRYGPHRDRQFERGRDWTIAEIRALLAQHPNPLQARVAELEARVARGGHALDTIRDNLQWLKGKLKAEPDKAVQTTSFVLDVISRILNEALDSAASQSGGKEASE